MMPKRFNCKPDLHRVGQDDGDVSAVRVLDGCTVHSNLSDHVFDDTSGHRDVLIRALWAGGRSLVKEGVGDCEVIVPDQNNVCELIQSAEQAELAPERMNSLNAGSSRASGLRCRKVLLKPASAATCSPV